MQFQTMMKTSALKAVICMFAAQILFAAILAANLFM